MLSVAILAAGKGTRMESSLPKVLHKISGKSLLERVIGSCVELKPDQIFVITGHKSNEVQKAIPKFDKNKLKPNFNFENLSLMEEEHLLTKASIPYRDQDLNSSKDGIISRRLDEQLLSNLLSTNNLRKKWEMTKSAFKR